MPVDEEDEHDDDEDDFDGHEEVGGSSVVVGLGYEASTYSSVMALFIMKFFIFK